MQTPYAMHQSDWPLRSPDSSWYTASRKAEQPICKECRIAKQEKRGVVVCSTIKAAQEKENALSCSHWTSNSQELEQQGEGQLCKWYILFIIRVNTTEDRAMKGGRSTFWARISTSAQNILLQEPKLIPSPTELQREKLILRATGWMKRAILVIYSSSPPHTLPPFLTVWYVIESCLWLIYIIFCPSPRHVSGRSVVSFPRQQPSEKKATRFELIYTVVLRRNIWETRLALLILTSPYQFLTARSISVLLKRISSKPMTWKLDSLCSWYKVSNCSQLLIHVQCMQIKSVMSTFLSKISSVLKKTFVKM